MDEYNPQSQQEKREEKEFKEEHIKTLKDLLKSSKKIEEKIGKVGAGGGSGGSGGKGAKGAADAIKNQVDKIKDAFANNKTVQFITDPIGVLGSGLQSAIAPLKNLVPDFSKIKDFGKGLLSNRDGGGFDSQAAQGLKSELIALRNIIEGRPTYTDQFMALESALGRIEKAISGQKLSPTDTDGLREDLSNLGNLQFETPQFDRFDLRNLSVEPQENVLGPQTVIQPITLNNPGTSLTLSDDTLEKQAESIGNSLANSIKGDDQLKREQERDRILREEERNEKLVGALKGIDLGGKIDVKGEGGLAGFFSNMFQAFTGGKLAGGLLAGLGLAIRQFLISVGTGFAALGAMIKPISLGAGALFVMGASLFPFIEALKSFGNIDNMKDSLINFGIGLTSLAVAAGILGGIMMSQVGAVALGLGAAAIFGLGLAILPLAGAFRLAAPGMENFGDFLKRVSEIGFLGLTGVAGGLYALGTAMGVFAGGSLLAFLTPGKGKMVDQLEALSKTGPGLKSVAESLDKVRTSLGNLKNINFKDIGISGFFKELNALIKIRKFKNKIEDAGEGIKSMFKQMGEGLEQIDFAKAQAVQSVIDSKLQVASGALDGFEVNNLANANAEMIRTLSAIPASGQGGDTNIVSSGDTVNNNTSVVNNPSHTNQATLQYLYGMGSFQGMRPTI